MFIKAQIIQICADLKLSLVKSVMATTVKEFISTKEFGGEGVFYH